MYIKVPFIEVLSILIVLWLVYRFLVLSNRGEKNLAMEITINLFFLYAMVLLGVTIFKDGYLYLNFDKKVINVVPLRETILMFTGNPMGVKTSLYNVLGNIVVFIPLGVFIRLLNKEYKFLKVVFIGFLVSLSLEIGQYFTVFNVCHIDHVIFNTLGIAVGLYVYEHIEKNKIKFFIDKVHLDNKKNMIKTMGQFISIAAVICVMVSLANIYCKSYTEDFIIKEKLSTQLNTCSENGRIITKDFYDYKLFVIRGEEHIELKVMKRILGDRYTLGEENLLVSMEAKDGYRIIPLIDVNSEKSTVIIFGQNNYSKYMMMNFNGKKYKEKLHKDDIFLVIYPQYEDMAKTTVTKNGDTQTLEVDFLTENNEKNTSMKNVQ